MTEEVISQSLILTHPRHFIERGKRELWVRGGRENRMERERVRIISFT